MKNLFLILMILTFSMSNLVGFSQENSEPEALGLPGDNLNLYAVLDLFQKSETIEAFETKLNEQDSKINNLDLNNDREIDFIKVVSEKDGNDYIFILQVIINNNEIQDVAVINVNKDKKNNVSLQIIGDETLYGKNYIVEPNSDTVSKNPGYDGNENVVIKEIVPVASSPVVVYMYSPVYTPYYSPWNWGYYPPYFHSWAPIYYRSYWGYHGHYYGNPYYRRNVVVVNHHHYNNYYANRNTSVTVNNYNRSGDYNKTYNGKNYSKPATRPTNPTTRPVSPAVRPTNPTTRPVSPGVRPTNPTTRPTNPTTRPVTPTTRPTSPTARPANPTTRPVSPATRPTNPTTRPANPTTRPVSPTTRPTNPTTRPTNTTTRSTSPSARQFTPRTPATKQTTPMPSNRATTRSTTGATKPTTRSQNR